MPKIVDHGARRAEILRAAWRVMVKRGLDSTTMRELADEAGYSTGTLNYYFRDKDEIFLSALILSHGQAAARIAANGVGLSGIKALRQAVMDSLPLDEERLVECQVELAFWGRALCDEKLRDFHRDERRNFWALLGHFVRAARSQGEITTTLTDDEIVAELMLLIDGLSTQAVLAPETATPKRQMQLLDTMLSRY